MTKRGHALPFTFVVNLAVEQLHSEYDALREDIADSGGPRLGNPEQQPLEKDATPLPSALDQSGALTPSVAVPDNL